MYSFFVADEAPVPEWPYKEPNNPEAIEQLSKVYFESGYNIKEMLRYLFKSDFFKTEEVWNKRVKSPVELVVGTLRLTKEFNRPDREQYFTSLNTQYMGQWLMSPPSVEGWHWGVEWLDSGTLVERVNFSSSNLGDQKNSGVVKLIENIKSSLDFPLESEQLVDKSLEQLGALTTSNNTRSILIDYADSNLDSRDNVSNETIAELLKFVGAMPEYQRA